MESKSSPLKQYKGLPLLLLGKLPVMSRLCRPAERGNPGLTRLGFIEQEHWSEFAGYAIQCIESESRE